MLLPESGARVVVRAVVLSLPESAARAVVQAVMRLPPESGARPVSLPAPWSARWPASR
ncbi:hypothetical protein [Streptomyces aureus]|uniref:hypothetical protein n=1 Tax=Streptomyces aureus TaxID=193461 RepID=UPI0033F92451